MAYAAVISLKHTIQRLLNSPRISIASPSREILEFAYEHVESLQEVLKRLEESRNKRMKDLEGQIREAVCKLEDVIEFHVSDQFLSQSEKHPLEFSLELEELRQDIDSFAETAKKMEDYTKELDNSLPEEDDDAAVSLSTDLGGNINSEMVGLSDELHNVKDYLLKLPMFAFSLVGMAGIGKTTFAKKIFEDPLIVTNFECRAFVTVGQRAQLEKMLQAIQAQVNPESAEMLMEEDEYLRRSLNGKRFLIILDDVWDADFWEDFRKSLPEEENGSRVLITTRLEKVAESIETESFYHMLFLNDEESWDLLRTKVFAKEVCPPPLEKPGRKIAENCEGLPLLIITVADLLSKAEITLEYWNEVAEKKNSIFKDACDEILKVLYPSYNNLPQYLKACFLYMGAFPPNHEVRKSRIINLWSAEGFLEPNPSQSLEDFAILCFMELVSNNLVLVEESFYSGKAKSCGLHSVFWNLCEREAGNNKFLHILNSLTECTESTRRFAIYKNILFSIKDVYSSMVSISTVRSLLCTGPHHHYQVPIYFGLRLLRVLDALTIRFYEFPMEVLKLIKLRYLALTYNGNLPSSISKLWNLQCLIILQHLSIKSSIAGSYESYLPMEIWDLQELKYLQIMGRNLPDPCGAILPNLLTLLDVGANSCTKSVLEGVPNLKKLRVQIELAPDDVEPLSCIDHISFLYQLTSLQCVVVNPELKSEVVAPLPPPSVFTSSLRKLTLSGLGYAWEDMNKIAELPNLEVLKLRCYAFRGQKWEVKEKGFLRLIYLSIEDTDLVQWTVGDETFPCLSNLTIIDCYKLQEIPFILSLKEIELIDCNPLASAYTEQIYNGDSCFVDVYVESSWDDGNL